MTNLEELARETADELEQAYVDRTAHRIENNIKVTGEIRIEAKRQDSAIILSALQQAVKERDEILELLTYSYQVNTGLKESVDGALNAGSDIDVPISGGLIKRAAELFATESRPTETENPGYETRIDW